MPDTNAHRRATPKVAADGGFGIILGNNDNGFHKLAKKRGVANPMALIALGSCLAGLTIGWSLRGGSSSPPKPIVHDATSVARWNNGNGNVQLLPDKCANIDTIEKEFSDWYKDGTFAHMQSIEAFYNNAEWPPKERKSASGPGSDLGYATQFSLDMLRKTIRDYNVKTMMDLPCGDNNWIFDAWETDSLDLYIGLDIVQPLVELDKMRFAHHSNKVFRHWDGTTCPLPQFQFAGASKPQPVDLIHSRDVLQHIGLQKGVDFLCNVFQSGAKLFVTTTFPQGENRDIKNGDFFLNDLTSSPYDLPKGKNCIFSHETIERDLTCLYDLREEWVQPWIQQKCSGLWKPKTS